MIKLNDNVNLFIENCSFFIAKLSKLISILRNHKTHAILKVEAKNSSKRFAIRILQNSVANLLQENTHTLYAN